MVELVTLVFPAFGLLLLGGGVGLVRKGRFYKQQSERVAQTEVSDVDSIGRGTVAVEGTARVDENEEEEEERTVTTALTGEPALVSQSSVTVKDDTTGAEDEVQSRRTIHDEARSVPFLVEDDSGTVRVDPPADADVRLDGNVETVRSRRVPEAAELADDPDAAATGAVPVGDSQRWRDRERRYEQGAIVPGESVYVLGEAVDRADWDASDFEIAGGETPKRFVVSDEGREAVASGGKIGAYFAYAIGTVLGLFGTLLVVGGVAALMG